MLTRYVDNDSVESAENCYHDDCDKESARALRKILDLLDDLNNDDLRLLDEIINRLLCSRKHKD